MSPAAAGATAIWAIASGTLLEFAVAQIAAGTIAPIHQVTIADATYSESSALAFDSGGNLWIAQGSNSINILTSNYPGRVIEFSAAQLTALATTPNPTPVVTIAIAGNAVGLAFDTSHNLWVSVFAFLGPSFQKFMPAQLASSGVPTPAVTLAGQQPGAIAFAPDGSLWSTDNVVYGPSGGLLFGLSPTQLSASGSPSAAYTLSVATPQTVQSGQAAIVSTPNGVAFDNAGNLWSNFDGYTFEFAASSLDATGVTPAHGYQTFPAVTAGGKVEEVPGYPLAFDAANDLILSGYGTATNTIDEYAGSAGSPLVAHYAASVPAPNGVNLGNAVTAGPLVP
jgi:hypothetical protein